MVLELKTGGVLGVKTPAVVLSLQGREFCLISVHLYPPPVVNHSTGQKTADLYYSKFGHSLEC